MEKDEILNLIKGLIHKATDPVGDILIEENGSYLDNSRNKISNSFWFKVEVKDPHLYTNKEGEAVFALNHLAKRIIEANSAKEELVEDGNPQAYLDVLIDINNFQKKKIESLHATIHMMAERARYFKSNIEMDPMSSFERRIVHEFLSDADDLKTESMGTGRDRKVVIKYIGDGI